MDCEERNRLLSEYSSAVFAASTETTMRLTFAGITALAEYNLLLRQQNIARSRAMKAHAAYERHITTHGCKVK